MNDFYLILSTATPARHSLRRSVASTTPPPPLPLSLLEVASRRSAGSCQSRVLATGETTLIRPPTKLSRAHQRSAVINKAVNCGSKILPHLSFLMDLAPSGSNLLPNMRKTLESYVFADYKEMIASVTFVIMFMRREIE